MNKTIRNDIYEARLSENLLSRIRQIQYDVFWDRKNREYDKFYVAVAILLAFIAAGVVLKAKGPGITDPGLRDKMMGLLPIITGIRYLMTMLTGALLGRVIAMSQNYKKEFVNHPITLGLGDNAPEYIMAFEYLMKKRKKDYADIADKCELLLFNILARGNFDIKYDNGGIPTGNCTLTLISPDGPGLCIESCILPEASQLHYLQWELSDDNEKSVRINPAIKSLVRKKEKDDHESE